MPRIILINAAGPEATILKTAFQNEPDYRLNMAYNLKQVKYYHDLDEDEPKLGIFGCGQDTRREVLYDALKFLDEVKYFFPDLKIILASTDSELLREMARASSDKIDRAINLSAEDGLKPEEIAENIKKFFQEIVAKETGQTRQPGFLVVDDDPSVLLILNILLKKAGDFNIFQAQTIDEAAKILTDKIEEIDLCLIDYNLKGQTSERLIQAIHRLDPVVKIILITGEGSEQKIILPEEITKAVFKIVTKPFNNEELITSVFQALEASRAKPPKPKILVIDDRPETANLLREIISAEFIIEECSDGESGLEKFKEFGPALVLLDYKLPGKNGLEILKELKAINPEAKVVIITVETSSEVTAQFLNLGASRVIYKPFYAEELEKIVRAQFEE